MDFVNSIFPVGSLLVNSIEVVSFGFISNDFSLTLIRYPLADFVSTALYSPGTNLSNLIFPFLSVVCVSSKSFGPVMR